MRGLSIITLWMICFLFISGKVNSNQDNYSLTKFYLHPSGTGDGSGMYPEQALGTLEAAKSAVRAVNSNMAGDIVVEIRGGYYGLTTPLTLTGEDSGTNGYRVIWRAFGNEIPVISGGRDIGGWSTCMVNGFEVLKAQVPAGLLPEGLRNLYVNGERRRRASSELIVPLGMSSDPNRKTPGFNGFVLSGTGYTKWQNQEDIEIHQQTIWRHFILPVTHIVSDDGINSTLVCRDAQKMAFLPPTHAGLKHNVAIRIENALPLLDQPGEFYFDRSSQQIYYFPLPGETISNITVTVPVLDRLLTIEGSDHAFPAENLSIEGLTFSYASWTGPNIGGWYGYDAGNIVPGAKNGISHPAVFVNRAVSISFNGNSFTRLGGAGLHLADGIHSATVLGNLFSDISATGLATGTPEGGSQIGSDLKVSNNLFHRTGQEFIMTSAFLSGPFLNAVFHHNEIIENPYMGFIMKRFGGSLPGMFGNWSVKYNRIETVMTRGFDGGAIYTWKSSSSDGSYSEISENYIRGVLNNDSQAIYLDDDCRFWTVRRNVMEHLRDSWLHAKGSDHNIEENFTTNQKSRYLYLHGEDLEDSRIIETGTVVNSDADWSQYPVALGVIENAGLEAAYRYLRDRISLNVGNNSAPVAVAGNDRTILLNDTLHLNPYIGDDGAPFGFLESNWGKVSGPGDVSFFGNHNTAKNIICSFSKPGVYALRFSAFDGEFRSSSDLTVTVLEDESVGRELTGSLPVSAFTASSSDNAHPVLNAFDGLNSSLWYPGYPGTGWLQVDLGMPRDIARIEHIIRQGPGHASSRKNFVYLVSNDPYFNSYVPVLGQGSDEFPADGIFPVMVLPFNGGGELYRYVRYSKQAGFNGVVNELRIFERIPEDYIAVTGVQVNPHEVKVQPGSSVTLSATVLPSDATNRNVAWSSSDTHVATVNSSGVVTANTEGTSVITVITDEGGFTDQCVVEVPGRKLTISPNPATDRLLVEADGFTDNAVVTIVSLEGIVMFIEPLGIDNNLLIDTSTMPKGVYLIKVSINQELLKGMFVVI